MVVVEINQGIFFLVYFILFFSRLTSQDVDLAVREHHPRPRRILDGEFRLACRTDTRTESQLPRSPVHT